MLKTENAFNKFLSFSKEQGYSFSDGQLGILFYSTYDFLEKLKVVSNPAETVLNAVKNSLEFNENFENMIMIAKCIVIRGYDDVKKTYNEKGMEGIKYLHLEIEEYYSKVRLKKKNAEQETINAIADWYSKNYRAVEFQYFLSKKGIDVKEFIVMDEKDKEKLVREFSDNLFRELLAKYSLYEIFETYPDEMPQLFVRIITEGHSIVSQFKEEKLIYNVRLEKIYTKFGAKEAGLNFEAFKYGIIAYYNAKRKSVLKRDDVFTIIDFTKPSGEPRLFVLDMKNRKILMSEYVSHGKGTGSRINPIEKVKYVGDDINSNLSPIGLMITASDKEYKKEKRGNILKIDGVEKEFNSNTMNRGVYFHKGINEAGLHYVSKEFAKAHGYVGRSFGCFAVDPEISDKLIDMIKGGSGVFVYFPTQDYMAKSDYIKEKEIVQELVLFTY